MDVRVRGTVGVLGGHSDSSVDSALNFVRSRYVFVARWAVVRFPFYFHSMFVGSSLVDRWGL